MFVASDQGCDMGAKPSGPIREEFPLVTDADWQRWLDERVWPKIDVGHPLGCWVWTAARQVNGYGVVFTPRKWAATVRVRRTASRVLYEALVGPVAAELELDHLCRNPPCVNPDHLEPVSRAENKRRSWGPSGRNARSSTCPRGHPYDVTVYNRRTGNPTRRCRTCHNEGTAAWARRLRGAGQ